MATQTVATPPTPRQIEIVLNDIAARAQAIRRFAVCLLHEEDERDAEAARCAIEALADRIGFLADLTASAIPGCDPVVSERADDWMLPPKWHDDQAMARSSEAAS